MAKRFKRLEIADLTPEQARFGERTLRVSSDGTGGPYNLLLRAPVVGETFADLLSYFNNKGMAISPKIRRRLLILTIARIRSAEYAWWAHSRQAWREGITEAQIDALNRGDKPADLEPLESAVFDFAIEALSLNGASDAAFGRLRDFYDERNVVEVLLLCGTYNTVGMILQLGEVDAAKDDGVKMLPLTKAPFGLE